MDNAQSPQLNLLTYLGGVDESPSSTEETVTTTSITSSTVSDTSHCVSVSTTSTTASPDERTVSDPYDDAFSVSELTEYLSQLIGNDPVLGRPVMVRAEVSGVNKSSRGHIYFSLKDDRSVIKGVIWAGAAKKLKFDLKDGLEVYATGSVDIYAPSGSYSLKVSRIEPVGVGALQLALEQLKAQLEAEGLFDVSRKRSLPEWPMRIGIVTSSTGSVIHDMLRVIRRKNPHLSVLIAPVTVQGDGAAETIAQGIEALNAPKYELDALIVGRGGGSFEDLFCFNEAPVVRAIAASRLPVVAGIGHEPDYSLSDAAADYSAQTPTSAAEHLVPDTLAFIDQLDAIQQRFAEWLQQILDTNEQRFDHVVTGLEDALLNRVQRADDNLDHAQQALVESMNRCLESTEQRLDGLGQALHVLSPLATLGRGFSMVQDAQGLVITSVNQVSIEDRLTVCLQDGEVQTIVQNVSTNNSKTTEETP